MNNNYKQDNYSLFNQKIREKHLSNTYCLSQYLLINKALPYTESTQQSIIQNANNNLLFLYHLFQYLGVLKINRPLSC